MNCGGRMNAAPTIEVCVHNLILYVEEFMVIGM